MTIDNTYLDKTITHLTNMLMIASGKPALPYSDAAKTFPFWMVFPRTHTERLTAEGQVIQDWRIGIIYAVAPNNGGYRGEHQRSLYIDIPAAINYLRAHDRLLYEATADIAAHLAKDVPYFQRGIVEPLERGNAFGIASTETVLGYEMDYRATYQFRNPSALA